MTARKTRRGKAGTVFVLLLMLGGMTTLVSFSVPLYRMFCAATGYQGTTQRASSGSDLILDKTIKVRFNTDVNQDLPWTFTPPQAVKLKIGERGLVFFKAQNGGTGPITGTAVFNVTPAEAGPYFNKIQCFCFTKQTLAAGESAEMPVSFFVDPKIQDDIDAKEIKTITLSYTFYPVSGAIPQSAARAADGSIRPAATLN